MSLLILSNLITVRDNWEIVRDQIADILAAETLAQQALAVTAAVSPEPYIFDVFVERSNPWSMVVESVDPATGELPRPIVHVWFDTAAAAPGACASVGPCNYDVQYNVDVYGAAISIDLGEAGHIPGDAAAVSQSQRIARLVRRILAADHNAQLQLPGIVGKCELRNITAFQLDANDAGVQEVSGMRLVVSTRVTETNEHPNLTTDLESVGVVISNDADTVLIEADYVTTQP